MPNVQPKGVAERPPVAVNDAAFVTLQFANQAQAMVQVSAVAHQADRGFEINVQLHGERGTLATEHIFFGSEAGVTMRGAQQAEERFRAITVPDNVRKNLDSSELMEPYLKQSAGPRLFIDAIVEERPLSPNFYAGWKVQEVIDAILVSHQQGCWVSLL